VLVVKVENDHICKGYQEGANNNRSDVLDGDKIYAATGLGWDDPLEGWHHCPPGMGIYQRVFIEARPSLFIEDIFVRPRPDDKSAEIWLEVFNTDDEFKPANIHYSVFGQNFKQSVCENKKHEHPYPENKLAGPGVNYFRVTVPMSRFRFWELDNPWLYQAQISLHQEDGTLIDARARQFGMRSFYMDQSEKPYGRFYLNNRSIRLRGANTMGHEQQCVFKGDFDQLLDDLLLAKVCNMNFLRLTQRPVEPEVYDLCDRIGLMTQTDLPLFAVLRRNQFWETVRQAGEMEKLIRSHPCNVIISYFNEPFPLFWAGFVRRTQRHLVRSEVEEFFECANRIVWLNNPDRVIKPVDGDYDPPAPLLPDRHCYNGWYNGHALDLGKLHKGHWQAVKPDWLYGCGEFGAEGLEDEVIMRRYYPEHWLPQNADEEKNWSPSTIVRAQTGPMHYLWMDTENSVADWIRTSQAHQVWANSVQTAAFRRDARMVSFAIHLFIDAFPAGWMKTIMDCERRPKPSFFAYRDLLTPLMVNLRTDRENYFGGESTQLEAWVCNDTHEVPANARLSYQLEIDGKVVLAQQTGALIEADTPTFQGHIRFPLPNVKKRTGGIARLALFVEGKQRHHCEQPLEIFPARVDTRKAEEATSVKIIGGNKDGKAKRLAEDLDLEIKDGGRYRSGDLILIDDLDKFHARYQSVLDAVEAGARAIFLELPETDDLRIGEKTFKVEVARMNPRHFVSRKTDHPIVMDSKKNDFRFWHNSQLGYCSPLLERLLITEDAVRPILRSGQTGWGETGQEALAACEWTHGTGSFAICQITLAGRTDTNPVARIFAGRLLTHHPA
jgi:hypothetical protein